jgi:hypothetical protein
LTITGKSTRKKNLVFFEPHCALMVIATLNYAYLFVMERKHVLRLWQIEKIEYADKVLRWLFLASESLTGGHWPSLGANR